MSNDVAGDGPRIYQIAITMERDHMTRAEAILKGAQIATQLGQIGIRGRVSVSATTTGEIAFFSEFPLSPATSDGA